MLEKKISSVAYTRVNISDFSMKSAQKIDVWDFTLCFELPAQILVALFPVRMLLNNNKSSEGSF